MAFKRIKTIYAAIRAKRAVGKINRMLEGGSMNLEGYRTNITILVGVLTQAFGSQIGAFVAKTPVLVEIASVLGLNQEKVMSCVVLLALYYIRKTKALNPCTI